VLHAFPHVVEAGHLAEGEERRQGEDRRRDEEDEGFRPGAIDFALALDVQVTQGRILR